MPAFLTASASIVLDYCFNVLQGGTLIGLVFLFTGIVGYERTFCKSKTWTGGYSHGPCVAVGAKSTRLFRP